MRSFRQRLTGISFRTNFPTFDLHREQLEPGFLGWYFKQDRVWHQLASDGKGIGARRERLHPRRLLDHCHPPSSDRAATSDHCEARRRGVATEDDAAGRRCRARGAQRNDGGSFSEGDRRRSARRDDGHCAARAATDCSRSRRKLPRTWRAVVRERDVPKTITLRIEVGNKRLFEIHEGDLLFNIVFAWEGAVALASAADHGRVGSHRFLTCVPDPQRATSKFLLYYFLTAEGTERLGAASPGGAGRNRTLGLKGLESIIVPAPSLDAQLWFDELQQKAVDVHIGQSDAERELDRLIPALLHQIFGEEPQCALRSLSGEREGGISHETTRHRR